MCFTIKAFIGTHYNLNCIKDLSSVICPPYDIIGEKELTLLKKKSPYNFSKILLASNNNYKEIGDRFRKWIKDGIIVKNKKRSLYLYEQEFRYEDKKYTRYGILGLLRMDKRGVIFPHEYTLKEPKEDRSRIIKEFKTNLSPIFVIVPKALEALRKIYRLYIHSKPFVCFKDFEGNSNRVWKIEDKKQIDALCRQIDKHKLVIADGHHRFEVSHDYYRKNKNKFKELNYILAYLTDAQVGLLVLPTHRIVKLKSKDLFKKLKEYFYLKEITENLLYKELKNTKGIFSFGIYKNNKFYYLRLKNPLVLDRIIYRPIFKRLDTYLLQNVVFPLLKVDGKISYTHSVDEAKKMAAKSKVAFLLRPTPLGIVFDLANKGFRLPQKSTYFYPKVPCGIVVRKFEK